MGVIYKLKDDIVQYILQQRQANALLSCRALAEGVESRFGVHLSKSSVHDVLKQAKIVSHRGRKPKSTFAIPAQKKQLIKADLSKALAPLGVGQETVAPLPAAIEPVPVSVVPAPMIVAQPAAPFLVPAVEPRPSPIIRKEIPQNAGEIFLKAIFWDLCPQKILGVKRFEDIPKATINNLDMLWEYLLTEMSGVKISLEDGSFYYLSARDTRVESQNPKGRGAPIERVIKEAADYILNNTKPLKLKKAGQGEAFESFLASFAAKQGKKIKKIEIVDRKDHVYADFHVFVDIKRLFILENDQIVENASDVEWHKGGDLSFLKGAGLMEHLKGRARAIFDTIGTEEWERVYALAGRGEISDNKINVTLFITEPYGNKQGLVDAVDMVNSWAVEDELGRRLRISLEG